MKQDGKTNKKHRHIMKIYKFVHSLFFPNLLTLIRVLKDMETVLDPQIFGETLFSRQLKIHKILRTHARRKMHRRHVFPPAADSEVPSLNHSQDLQDGCSLS